MAKASVVKHDGPAVRGINLADRLAQSMSKYAHGSELAPKVIRVPEPGKHTHSHTEKVGPATHKIDRTIERIPAGMATDMESVNRVLFPQTKGQEPPPAAGRMMEVLKTQQNVEAGRGKPTAELTQLTQLIREGGHKAVAGMAPERVKEIVQQSTSTPSLPGPSRDPDVRLIGQKFEGPLHMARKNVERADSGARREPAPAPSAAVARHESVPAPSAAVARHESVPGSPVKPPAESKAINDKQVVNKLLNMVDSNETTHINMAGEYAREKENGGSVTNLGLKPNAPGTVRSFIRGGLVDEKGNAPGFNQKTEKYIATHGFDTGRIRLPDKNGELPARPAHHTITSPDMASEPSPQPRVDNLEIAPRVASARSADRVVSPAGPSPKAVAGVEDQRYEPVYNHGSVSSPVSGKAAEVMKEAGNGGGKTHGSSDRKRLEGTLKLVGAAGQTLGEAHISAMET